MASKSDEVFLKISEKLFKLSGRLLKRTMSNILHVRHCHKIEVYIILSSILLTFTILVKYNMPKISLILLFQYFFWKAVLQISKEQMTHIKYLHISKMFNDKVKVVHAKNGIYRLHSYVSKQEIEKHQHNLEHSLNRPIIEIKRNEKNFKDITIVTEDRRARTKKKSVYKLSDYIKKVNITKKKIPCMLGVDENGKHVIGDLDKMIHTMISGEPGGGKSTLVNCIIQSLLYFNNNLSMVLVDFKKVELNVYGKLKNCLFCNNHEDFLKQLENINKEMDRRYSLLEKAYLTDLDQYNKHRTNKLPVIVLIVDEIADIKMSMNKDNNDRIEELLRRIGNMGRAARIYMICATQRPSGIQISTEIRAFLKSKISFAVQETTTQKMTGVMNTQSLGKGEFITSNMNLKGIIKGYYVDREKEWDVFREIEKIYGGVSLDKK